jgi:hypothetical protein
MQPMCDWRARGSRDARFSRPGSGVIRPRPPRFLCIRYADGTAASRNGSASRDSGFRGPQRGAVAAPNHRQITSGVAIGHTISARISRMGRKGVHSRVTSHIRSSPPKNATPVVTAQAIKTVPHASSTGSPPRTTTPNPIAAPTGGRIKREHPRDSSSYRLPLGPLGDRSLAITGSVTRAMAAAARAEPTQRIVGP